MTSKEKPISRRQALLLWTAMGLVGFWLNILVLLFVGGRDHLLALSVGYVFLWIAGSWLIDGQLFRRPSEPAGPDEPDAPQPEVWTYEITPTHPKYYVKFSTDLRWELFLNGEAINSGFAVTQEGCRSAIREAINYYHHYTTTEPIRGTITPEETP